MKAYDKLPHDVLLEKLITFGLHPDFVIFIASYLRDREHRVCFDSGISKPYYPTSSVIQGSKLSSLFFSIVINEIGSSIRHSEYVLFADDLKIYKKINDRGDCVRLQEDLNSVSEWLTNLHLNFHPDKCEIMSITRKQQTINFTYHINEVELVRVNSKRDLGIIYQQNLKFEQHYTNITSAANRNLGLILRHSKYLTDFDTIITLYTALVRSKLEYASIIWAPNTRDAMNKLEQIQAKFVRVLFFKYNGFYPLYPNPISYNNLLDHLNINSLETRRKMSKLLFIHNLVNNKLNCPGMEQKMGIIVPNVNLRQRRDRNYFYIPGRCSSAYAESPLISALTLYNRHSYQLDLAISFSHFKEECKCILN
ncbi:hypothetical protein WDU94_009866 [Cyamophila willieti]